MSQIGKELVVSNKQGPSLNWIMVSLVLLAAWLTHVVSCLLTAKYMLLFVGLFFPIGIIHGAGLWFGIPW